MQKHEPQDSSTANAPTSQPGNVFLVTTPQSQANQDELQAAYDPRRDGWDSEAFHEEANQVLQALAKGLSLPRGDVRLDDVVSRSAAPQCAATALRPSPLHVVFDDGVFEVKRPEKIQEQVAELPVTFGESLAKMLMPWRTLDAPRIAFKQFGVSLDGDIPTSKVFYSGVGNTQLGRLQQEATWECRWLYGKTSPRLSAIRLLEYEETLLKLNQSTLFSDCTEAALGRNACYAAQIVHGANYWLERLPEYPLDCLQGISVGDVDGDGLEDVYLSQGTGLPNRLFLAQPDGTLVDASKQYGVDFLDETRSSLLVDLDNDGDQDLVVATIQALVVMENDAGRRFQERWRTGVADDNGPQVKNASSMAAADLNCDGLLDIYVAGYTNEMGEIGVLASPTPYHDANNGAANLMLAGHRDFQFQDVTEQWGLNHNNTRFSLAVAFEDYDGDGDLDLYVTNDFGRNNLYRNITTEKGNPRFEDVAAAAGVEDTSFGMSVSWGDVNRDRKMDLYISNMFSAAGNRVTYQRQFMEGTGVEHKQKIQYLARGNSLFLGQKAGDFLDVSQPAAVMNSQWTWASKFCDINNDGWQDLLALNGFLTGPQPGDL